MSQMNTFTYTYSAQMNREVLNIREKYLPKQKSGLETLKELDAKVKKTANIFGYAYGSVSAVIMGAGMSLVMTDIGAVIGLAGTMVPGIAIGVAGMIMTLTTYPIYKNILNARRMKYAPEILRLSEEIMKG